MHSPLFQAFVYLAAAVVTVPLAKRLGLGSVLGYLVAGAAIGPFGLAFVGSGEGVVHVAEFGVVMMLFLVGLELQPRVLWRMRGLLLGLGGLQMVGTSVAIAGAAIALDVPWRTGVAIGLTLAMSSTAIVLQTLAERGVLKTPGGEAAFGVLLFQDIAVIPILAVFPLLALEAAPAGVATETGWIDPLPGWGQALVVLGAVVAVVAAGRYLVRPLFHFIAASGLREMFTAAALLLVVGIALLMTSVGLSPALGTFLAGVVLADSEYRHELEGDIEPFKGLLLGLFFIAVGAGIDFGLLVERPAAILGVVAALVVIKFVVLLVLGRGFRLGASPAYMFAFALAQGGEFAFVLCAFGLQSGVFTTEVANVLVVSVALSMAVAPLLFIVDARVVQPCFVRLSREERPADEIPAHENRVVVAGVGRFGHIVLRLLRANGFTPTVLDHDYEQVEVLRRIGFTCFYGDASRLELLHAAGLGRARLLVLAVDEPAKSLEIAEKVRKHFPEVAILARAYDRQHVYALMRLGVTQIFRETFDSSLELSIAAMRGLGMRGHRARRVARTFRLDEEESIREFAEFGGDEDAWFARARQRMEEFERVMRERASPETDPAWDTESLRRDGTE